MQNRRLLIVLIVGIAGMGYVLGRMGWREFANNSPPVEYSSEAPIETSEAEARPLLVQEQSPRENAAIPDEQNSKVNSKVVVNASQSATTAPLSTIIERTEKTFGEMPASMKEQQRIRAGKIQAGEIIESKVRNFDADFAKLSGELKPLEDVAPRLTKSPSVIDETTEGLVFLGAIVNGSPRGADNDGLMRLYRSSSVGVVVLTEYDTKYVRATIASEMVNAQVNGRPATLVKMRDPDTGDSIGTLSWSTDESTYTLRIGRIDEQSLSHLRTIASSIEPIAHRP